MLACVDFFDGGLGYIVDIFNIVLNLNYVKKKLVFSLKGIAKKPKSGEQAESILYVSQ